MGAVFVLYESCTVEKRAGQLGVDASLAAASCQFAAAVPAKWPAWQGQWVWLACLTYIYIHVTLTFSNFCCLEVSLSFHAVAACKGPARLAHAPPSPAEKDLSRTDTRDQYIFAPSPIALRVSAHACALNALPIMIMHACCP